MRTMKGGLAALTMLGCIAGAHAQEKGCILLKTVAEIQQTATDERGRPSTRLVPAEKVVPGDEVVYTVSATNVCESDAEKVVIDNPIPEHMNYVAQTATGPGTDVTFSVDGGFNYAAPQALSMANPDGTRRPAVAADYTHIRWVMRNPLKPGAVAFATFRAVLE